RGLFGVSTGAAGELCGQQDSDAEELLRGGGGRSAGAPGRPGGAGEATAGQGRAIWSEEGKDPQGAAGRIGGRRRATAGAAAARWARGGGRIGPRGWTDRWGRRTRHQRDGGGTLRWRGTVRCARTTATRRPRIGPHPIRARQRMVILKL